jgi:hypothetical protein
MNVHTASYASLSACVLCCAPQLAAADAVTDWNATAGAAALAACIAPADDPLHESRMYAMAHIAMHDALNAIDRRSRPYAADFQAPPGASEVAAVAAAARDVLVSQIALLPAPFPQPCRDGGVARVEADYAAALGAIPDTPAKALGIGVGQTAAAAIVARRAADGSDTLLIDTTYPQGTQPGEYRFTPGFNFVFAPGWGKVAPFVLRHAAQFRPDAPHEVSCGPRHQARGCRKYAEDYREVKAYGGDGIVTHSRRTAEQTEIALFWVESSPLAWNRLARSVAHDKELDLWQNARLFGLLNMAMADGYVATFSTKYHYNYWRPVTAIHNAHTDGNPYTDADPTWTPLRPTPPIPDFDSGHSVQGGAAAQVLRRVFRRDHIAFSACSLTLPAGSTCNDPTPVIRSYSSFSQAARENGVSRIYVGFHFREAVEEGIAQGRKIGERAVDEFMRPVK